MTIPPKVRPLSSTVNRSRSFYRLRMNDELEIVIAGCFVHTWAIFGWIEMWKFILQILNQ